MLKMYNQGTEEAEGACGRSQRGREEEERRSKSCCCCPYASEAGIKKKSRKGKGKVKVGLCLGLGQREYGI
uniref:Uncharacterized protein n=1 Tax=Rhizophora mucronata TaxID=61149 RepID=A0A2P2KKL6_RHIMU